MRSSTISLSTTSTPGLDRPRSRALHREVALAHAGQTDRLHRDAYGRHRRHGVVLPRRDLEAAGEGETVTFQRLLTHRRDLLEVYAQEHRDARLIPDDADAVIALSSSTTSEGPFVSTLEQA